MSTHKALVLSSHTEPIAVKNLPTPSATSGSALVSPIYAGIGSNARLIFTGKLPYPLRLPLTPGQSCIARVGAVGPDATSLKPGDIVWVDPTISSRDDSDTKILLGLFGGGSPGAEKLMEDGWRHGCYAEKALVPLENCFVLPESLFKSKADGGQGYTFKDLASLSTALVAYGGLESAGVCAGKTVIIAPATGKFSGGAVLAALAMGAKVIAASRSEENMKRLYAFPGAKERLTTVTLASDVEKDTAALLKATGGKGAEVFIDFCPPAAGASGTPTHITAAISVLKRNGQAVLMGGIISKIELPYILLMLKSITVRGQFMYGRPQVMQFIRMLQNGNLVFGESVGLNVAGTFSMEKIEEGLDLAESGAGWGDEVLLAPNGEQ
ncbi:chaperonin 10-like protein [Clohesyomyces aquaticus]|uniref:Chaperonin 10-like protein n=1 Tax=Clohesyomyces aquaticus TaxID=1231657 RepID=A0A1Y1ZJ00_9PLEO|nr:chaperonin 10-like protein [Clohesyomyces aquaticus]